MTLFSSIVSSVKPRLSGGIKALGLASMGLVLGACGGGSGGVSGIVKNVKVEKRVDPSNQDLMLDIISDVDVGSLIFQNITIGIGDPDKPLERYGTVTLRRTLDGKNQLVLSTNMTQLTGVNLLPDGRLPNGNPVPVFGSQTMTSIAISRAGKLYLDIGSGRTILGAAVGLKELKEVGKYIPGIDIFFEIPRNDKVSGVAGIFTGVGERDNGLAIFVDVTEVLGNLANGQVLAASLKEDAPTAKEAGIEIKANDKFLNTRKGKDLAKRLYKLSQQRKTLHVTK